MDILNVPVNTISFTDIEQFCNEGWVEGVQLDYKRELPAKGLAKHFASFSNTRGGLIIIGVAEDSKTGKPDNWQGIRYDDKLVDRIHQYAMSVDPRPSYEVHVTDEQHEKVFILIRVFEGDRTPYYVHNDANIYLRTGNITDPIDLASPEAAELLFGKKNRAELARQNYILRTFDYLSASIKLAEKKRLQTIAEEREQWDKRQNTLSQEEFQSSYTKDPIGTNISLTTILLQPFFPKSALTTPQELLSKVDQYRASDVYQDSFPIQSLHSIQDGVLGFDWDHTGSIQCQQIYANGLLYDATDVTSFLETGKRVIYLDHVAIRLILFLKAASSFYVLFGYQGGLKGFLRMEKVEDTTILPIVPNNRRFGSYLFENQQGIILSTHEWELDLDTALLNDPSNRKSLFIEKITEIYWSLGFRNIRLDYIEKFLESYSILFT